MNMIRLENISVTFNEHTVNPVKVLESLSLSFHENEWTFIIGGNGCGKSTLLKIVNKNIVPNKGNIIYQGVMPEDILLVDQTTMNNLIPSMTIYENLVFAFKDKSGMSALKFYHSKAHKHKVFDMLSTFGLGLENRLNEQVRFLSGGEQQIIVASRIMLSKPKFLLMDEFTSALDQKWGPFILSKLKSFAVENGISVLAVTHDYNQIEYIGDRVILLKDGVVSKDVRSSNQMLNRDYILSIFYGKE